jgi:mannose-6-phosphate isomerase, type 1 (EC 5.3.1.8)
MFKLQNNIQHYAWGSLTALSDYFGYANPKQLPMAELWMGAHPSASSLILMNGTWQSLREEIAYHSESMLGKEVALRFHQLPFLVKVLAVEQPLSIQVHPNRLAAKQGFIQENAQGLPVDSPIRNYRDANHKPELIYTLTPFTALNGFKPLVDIVHAFQAFDCGMTEANIFIKNPNRDTLQKLFLACLCLDGEEKPRVLHELKRVAEQLRGDPWLTVLKIAKYWPTDHGLFMPLFLNIVHLVPGQAMYLAAGTPHTYLHGLALEVMANSDNVLRAGLTAKHIDINELVKNVVFKESHPEIFTCNTFG